MKLHIGRLLTLTSKIKQTAYRLFVYLLWYPVWEKYKGSLTCIPVVEVAEWNKVRKCWKTSNHHRWMIYLLNSLRILEFINVTQVNHSSIRAYKPRWSYLNSPPSCKETSVWMHFACYRSYLFRLLSCMACIIMQFVFILLVAVWILGISTSEHFISYFLFVYGLYVRELKPWIRL